MLALPLSAAADISPEWQDTATRKAIVEFFEATTTPTSLRYVAPGEWIVLFDNDGTLWSEQPACFQSLFAVDRVRVMAPPHPDRKDTEQFKSVLGGSFQTLEWVTWGAGQRCGRLVHDTDAGHEYAGDRGSCVGRLERGLQEAAVRGWVVIDMKRDLTRAYP